MNSKPHLPPYDVRQVVLTRLLQELSNWAFRFFKIEQLWEHSKGKGVRVAVLDTGCTHKDISVRKFVNFSDDVDEDRSGHGSWCAGCVRATKVFQGIAPESELYIAKILNNDGSGDWNWMKKGLQWVLEEEVHIVSISAGGDYTGVDIQPILKELYDKGVVVVCAAGNANDFLIFPANDECTLAVGAVDKNLQKARFSNFGPRLIVMAPGVELLGCWTDNGYAKLSGTSMATPIISGILALERGLRSINLRDVIAKIAWTSKDMKAFGWDMSTGWGLIEPKKFMLIEPTDKKITWAWIVNLLTFFIAYFVGDEENRVTAKRALFGRR